MERMSVEEVMRRTGVDSGFLERLGELGAIESFDRGFDERDAHLVALLRAWEDAGLAAESILAAVRAGNLSFDFLETPGWTIPERLDLTFRELSEREGVSLEVVTGLHEAIGFQAPEPDDSVSAEDLAMVDLVKGILTTGISKAAARRIFRLYAENMRRLVTAEVDVYLAELQKPLEDLEFGSQLGRDLTPLVHQVLLAIYERHRRHLWTEYSISRAEVALEAAGLRQRVTAPPTICFVDMTGYSRLTEIEGDEVAAKLAASLAVLVDEISRSHGGRAIRWLGDGGMFHFKETVGSMLAALEMVDRAPGAGLPPTHIGIHSGPVVFQDGDVFGRTVNVAARIAEVAQANEVLTTEESVELVDDPRLRFDHMGVTSLKGMTEPVTLYRVLDGVSAGPSRRWAVG